MRWAGAVALLSCCLFRYGAEANAKHPGTGVVNSTTSSSSSDQAFQYFDGAYSGGAATAAAGMANAQATLANLTMNCIITNIYVYKGEQLIGRTSPQMCVIHKLCEMRKNMSYCYTHTFRRLPGMATVL